MYDPTQAPVPMILKCPGCGRPHIDGSFTAEMTPHKKHKCMIPFCYTEWTPHEFNTIGVEALLSTDPEQAQQLAELFETVEPGADDVRDQLQDMLDDAHIERDMIREALGVPYEPHQSLRDRIAERIAALTAIEKAAQVQAREVAGCFTDFCAKRDARKAGSVDYKHKEAEAFALAVAPLTARQAAPKTACKLAQDSPQADASAIHRPTLDRAIQAVSKVFSSAFLNDSAVKALRALRPD